MSVEHLPAAESSFLADGYRAACSCGWRAATLVPLEGAAVELAREIAQVHQRAEALADHADAFTGSLVHADFVRALAAPVVASSGEQE